jgi:hypothetical protein
MELSLSRLYQIQKRVLKAMNEALNAAESLRYIRITNPQGTESEAVALEQRFQQAEASYSRYLRLGDLYGKLRAIVAENGVEASKLQSRLEVVNRRVAFLEGILNNGQLPVTIADLAKYAERLQPTAPATPWSNRPEVLVSRNQPNDEFLTQQLKAYRKESVFLQDRIAEVNQLRVALDQKLSPAELQALEEFVG